MVLVVIFGLLYITYHSALEAVHVLMAVPFALTGGIYLLWFLGYSFSVAVWVGFIALSGTAVQTAVVMVIYLVEAVARKRGEVGELTRATLLEAVTEGVHYAATEGHDCFNRRRVIAADHVEHKRVPKS